MQDRPSVLAAIGNTPLIKLRRASEETGCTILGKAEFMNPGQSVKDRAALAIVEDAIAKGALRPGGTIVDGTAGNTGIGLTMVGNALGMKTVIVIPETQTQEKKDTLRLLGAELVEVPAVPYRNPNNYVKLAGRLAERLARENPNGAIWANQFDNVANRDAHVRTTGPEIWDQTEGKVDGFVSAIGTGGTLAGVALALRDRNPKIQIALADVPGAAMHHYYTAGELKAEGSSITEGIGQGRVTANLEGFAPDQSYRIADATSVAITFALLEEEGLGLGLSSGVDLAGAIRLARELGPGHVIVTMLCDPATRYQSRLFNPAFLRSKGLPVPPWLEPHAGIEPDYLPVDRRNSDMTLSIGSIAPDFTAETTQGSIHFHDWIGDSWAILFSHPKAFTPVCTTELGYMAGLEGDFAARNTRIIGLSVDTSDDNRKWLPDIEEVSGNKVGYPVIGDSNLNVAKLYNMLPANSGDSATGRTAANNATVRTVYIIGPDKKIRAMLLYPMSSGRNFDEVLRLLNSVQLTENKGVATPVNWRPGEHVIIPPSVSDEAAKEKYPDGWETVKPYLRTIPQPAD